MLVIRDRGGLCRRNVVHKGRRMGKPALQGRPGGQDGAEPGKEQKMW